MKGLKELKLLVKQRITTKIWQTIYQKHMLLPYFYRALTLNEPELPLLVRL